MISQVKQEPEGMILKVQMFKITIYLLYVIFLFINFLYLNILLKITLINLKKNNNTIIIRRIAMKKIFKKMFC